MKKVIILLIASSFMLFGCSGDFLLQTTFSNPDQNPANQVDRDTIHTGLFVNRIYKVGMDIPAGEYYISLNEDVTNGYFAVATDSEGLDVIYNDYITDHSYVTVSDGQYLVLMDVTATPVDQINLVSSENGIYTDGVYKVGHDIEAGEYKIVPHRTTIGRKQYYYAVYSDSTYENKISGETIGAYNMALVNLKDGEYLMLNNVYAEVN